MKLGLQLFTLQSMMKEPGGLRAVLKTAADAGYDGVEFAGFGDLSVDEVKEELDKNHLEAAGLHLGWGDMTFERLENDFDSVIEVAKKLGLRALVCASYPAKAREDWLDFAKRIDKSGAMLREQGILLGYHNHRFELRKVDGEYGIDVLMESCSPENVFWELDPRHIQITGESPVEFAKKYSGRIPLIHMRDIAKITGDDTADDSPVGSGIVDIKGVVKASGVDEWLIVEENCCPDIGAHIKQSADFIRREIMGGN